MVYHEDRDDEFRAQARPAHAASLEDPLGEDSPETDDSGTDEAGHEAPARHRTRRRRLERILPDVIKRAIEKGLEAGLGTLTNGGEALRGVVNKVELPREIAAYVLSQVDDTKNAVVRVVAREVREFLEAADLATELRRALTSLSFEIRTEIRFVPNDAGELRPDVKARVGPAGEPRRERRRGLRRPSAEAAEGCTEGESEER